MEQVITHLSAVMPEDAIVTNGAGIMRRGCIGITDTNPIAPAGANVRVHGLRASRRGGSKTGTP